MSLDPSTPASMESLHASFERGELAVRTSVRLGEWMVRTPHGDFEVKFDVDAVVLLSQIPSTRGSGAAGAGEGVREGGGAREGEGEGVSLHPAVEAALLAHARGERHHRGGPLVFTLSEAQRDDLDLKTNRTRAPELLQRWTATVRWGSTSEHQTARSYDRPEEANELLTLRAQLPVHVVAFTRRAQPGTEDTTAAPVDRFETFLANLRAREVTTYVEHGFLKGWVVHAPAPCAGHPYGVATFEADQLTKLVLPFGTTILDLLRQQLANHALQVVPLPPTWSSQLHQATTPNALPTLLTTHTITLTARSTPLTATTEADLPQLLHAIQEAFMATLEFHPKKV